MGDPDGTTNICLAEAGGQASLAELAGDDLKVSRSLASSAIHRSILRCHDREHGPRRSPRTYHQPMTTEAVPDAAIESFLDDRRDERLESYKEFLRIPSISALPQHAADCEAAAEWIAADLRAMGVEHVEVAKTGSHPIVYGDWLHADGAPTVIVYCHYDVQPVDPLDLWDSPPFEPVVVGDRILARGSADDKGQLHLHLRATQAILATRGGLPVNLKFVFEGDEESNAIHLEQWLTANRSRLSADFALISDTGFFEGNLPAITVGLRGIMYAQIDVTGTAVDLHSGSYGGAVQNPANALAQIITALKGPDGRIRIPGFYDDVVPLTDDERAAIAALPFDEEAYRETLGLPALVGEAGFSTLERRGTRPTLDVNGIWGGFHDEGTKTIIPAHAHAKISCRLVAAQRPDEIFELLQAYIAEIAPPGVVTTVTYLGGGHPSLTPIDHPATQAAARALEATFGQAPVYIREGGSIPVCASFEQTLGLPVVLLGFDPPDQHAHAPNEWMDLTNYERGIRTVVRMWDEVANLDPSALAAPGR
jgi:acetylornithine deacetylase/succinyl-diaminopimelate desuccinylase-like protein